MNGHGIPLAEARECGAPVLIDGSKCLIRMGKSRLREALVGGGLEFRFRFQFGWRVAGWEDESKFLKIQGF
jgi:hypothetical protein